MRQALAERGPRAEQGLRYLAVGAFNTISSFLLFVALVLLFADDVPYMALLVVSMVLSVVQGFVLHRRFVFRHHGPWLPALGRFSLVYAGAFAINLVLLPILVDVLGLPVLVAQPIVVVTVVVSGLLGHRNFSFRESGS